MADSTASANIELSLTVTLTESEVRALDAIMGYGTEAFLQTFYEDLGTSYLKRNEAGVHSLFNTLRPQCQMAITRIDSARKVFNKPDAQHPATCGQGVRE